MAHHHVISIENEVWGARLIPRLCQFDVIKKTPSTQNLISTKSTRQENVCTRIIWWRVNQT
jgi:hypothetical protein